jgi:UDPglucose 6-dehydrogenase
MRIAVIGTGYVGLVTGTCFAEVGHHVTCLDIDKKKIAQLRRGEIPIYEPGLEEKVRRNSQAGRLVFTTDYAEAVPGAEVIFLAVPTPSNADGSANLGFLRQATFSIAAHLTDYAIIVNKSTAPVGTTREIGQWLEPFNLDVAVNPEFLKQGNAVQDFLKPDRVIIGADKPKVARALHELYAPFSLNHDRILEMDTLSAEMAKYASNAMLATRISFMNEIAHLCERTGADINRVRLGLGADSRIGRQFLYAGAGFGGSCFPKDLEALLAMGREHECKLDLLDAAHSVNERQKRLLGEKITAHLGDLNDKTIGILGLSFKPETDDMRCAPSLTLIHDLLAAGATLRLYDPVAIDNARTLLGAHPSIAWCANELDCALGAHALVLMTEWKQFRRLDLRATLANMCGNALFDGRNQYKRHEVAAAGFDYIGIGQQPAAADADAEEEKHEAAAGLSH